MKFVPLRSYLLHGCYSVSTVILFPHHCLLYPQCGPIEQVPPEIFMFVCVDNLCFFKLHVRKM